jgi:hypothetical protein
MQVACRGLQRMAGWLAVVGGAQVNNVLRAWTWTCEAAVVEGATDGNGAGVYSFTLQCAQERAVSCVLATRRWW